MTATVPMFLTFLDGATAWDSTRPNELFLKNHEATEDQELEESARTADTISRLVDLLEDNGEDDYGMLGPTQFAFRSVFKLIRDAQKQTALRVSGSPVVDSLGGIRITWNRSDREIRLVCPASRTEQVYIYQQSELRNQAIHGVTPDVLADKLSWLVSGGDIL
ncbi:MAG: hypothetical protein ACREBQ_10135 [Nitrososphaerales archaeon]